MEVSAEIMRKYLSAESRDGKLSYILMFSERHKSVVKVWLVSQFFVHQACYSLSLIPEIVSLFLSDKKKKLFFNYNFFALFQSEIAQCNAM